MFAGIVDQLVVDYIRTLAKTEPTNRPVLIGLVGGLGSGKTYLASLLAKDLNLTILSEQDIKNFFLPRREFLNQGEAFLIEFLTKSARGLVKQKISAVADINLATKADRDGFRTAAGDNGAACFLIHVDVPKEVAFQRVSDRNEQVETGFEKGELFSNDYFEIDFARIENPVDTQFTYNSTHDGDYEILKTKIRSELLQQG
jgi:predicted kinase